MSKRNKLWDKNSIQFPRLLAEINAAGLDNETMQILCDSMDLTPGDIEEILNRAERAWERIKRVHLRQP